MPAVDLRELVKSPIALTGTLVANREPHPLHDSVKRTRVFSSPSASPIVLPRGGRGLQRLKLAIQEQIPGMPQGRSEEVFVRLLMEGFSLHTDAGEARLGPDGEVLDADVRARTRSVLLLGVFRDAHEQFADDMFSSARFAGVGVLTILPATGEPKQIDDAWLQMDWVHSTGALLHSLAQIEGLRLEAPHQNRRIHILVSPHLVATDATFEAGVARTALVLGASPQIHVVTPEERGNVANKVRASNPFELVVLGTDIPDAVTSEFTRRHGERNLHRAKVASADDAMRWLVDNLPRIMGVGPGLMSYPEIEAQAGRPRMPVQNPTKCLHDGNNTYVLDATTDEWWTRDFAQHGSTEKSVFKTYSLMSNTLIWQADRDGLGQVIVGKRKGEEGRVVPGSGAHSCAHPESHLH